MDGGDVSSAKMALGRISVKLSRRQWGYLREDEEFARCLRT
jgi:hypothetical protein